MCPINPEPSQKTKQPKAIFPNIFVFPPNRDTLGGTSYFIVGNEAKILIDCPAWEATNQDFLSLHGGVDYLVITHRGAIGKTPGIQQRFNCEILIQEQEAYLLPELKVTTFREKFQLNSSIEVIWTPGHSPGSSCLYYGHEGGIIFSGRHLLPNQQGEPQPLRTAKTFHWRRQINSVRSLLAKFSPTDLQYILPGANTGFLRGKGVIDNAYGRLAQLDLQTLLQTPPLL